MKFLYCLFLSFIIAILILGLLVIFDVTPVIYEQYEIYFLDAKYVGETKAMYYVRFLFSILLPMFWLLSFVTLYFTKKRPAALVVNSRYTFISGHGLAKPITSFNFLSKDASSAVKTIPLKLKAIITN